MMRFNPPPTLREGWVFYLFVAGVICMLMVNFWRIERDARTRDALTKPLPAGVWDSKRGVFVIDEPPVTPPPRTAP